VVRSLLSPLLLYAQSKLEATRVQKWRRGGTGSPTTLKVSLSHVRKQPLHVRHRYASDDRHLWTYEVTDEEFRDLYNARDPKTCAPTDVAHAAPAGKSTDEAGGSSP
jgi:hypothetical protein